MPPRALRWDVAIGAGTLAVLAAGGERADLAAFPLAEKKFLLFLRRGAEYAGRTVRGKVPKTDDRVAKSDSGHKQEKKAQVEKGTVKWFNDAKGFGFVTPENGADVFVHHTAIISEGFRSLAEGDKVEFEITKGPKGLQASNLRKI